jgi:PAS domain S-box-containing protein
MRTHSNLFRLSVTAQGPVRSVSSLASMRSKHIASLGLNVGVAVVYLAAAKLGLSLAFLHSSVSPVWPPTGVAIAAVLWLGYRVWPAILLGALMANLGTPVSVATAGGIAIGNTLEAVTAAFLVHRYIGSRSPFYRAQDVLKFVMIAGILAPVPSATIGNLSLCISGAASWTTFGWLWLTWWLGDGSGALVVAPLVLTWVEKPFREWSSRRLLEGALLLLSLCAIAAAVFGNSFLSGAANYPLGHLTIPFLLWAAFRFGPRGVASAIAALFGIAIWGTTRGFGPFIERNLNESLLMLQVFVVALAMIALALAAIVSERQRAQIADAFAASIVESTDDAVIGKELDGTIISWNNGAARAYGYTAEEVIGRSIAILIPADRADDLPRFLEALKRGESINHYETVRIRKDGSRIDVSLTISPIREQSGKIIGASTIGRDIAHRKQIEEERKSLFLREQAARAEAEAANRAKDEFLAVLSHELRTPLNAIVGWVDLLLTKPGGDDAVIRALETIRRNATLQTRIIEDILDVSRIVAGKLPLDIQEVDLVSVIQAALTSILPMADAKQVRIRSDLDPKALHVAGDPRRLQQVIWNLLSNAIKFSPVSGEVGISLKQVGFESQISVADNGEGIAADQLPHIFDRFRQADSSTTRKHGGLGLGLAIVRHLVEAQGGKVHAFSEGRGKGAIFTVTLPSAPEASRALEEEPSGDYRGVGKESATLPGFRILIVDDDADSRELLDTALRFEGAETRSAATVPEALEIFGAWKPDLLVSDLCMPDSDGFELIRKIRSLPAAEGGQIPAIALTGYAALEDEARALSAGYQMRLTKPISTAALVKAIASVAGTQSSDPGHRNPG